MSPYAATEDARGNRTYNFGGRLYWSVTTILSNSLAKLALIGWAKKVTAEAAVNGYAELGKIIKEEGNEAALRWLKDAANKKRDAAADIGTECHKAAEMHQLGQPLPLDWPVAIQGHMIQFAKFLHAYRPTWEMSEATVYSKKHNYAGTLDAIAVIDGKRYIIDLKTSANGPYPDWALQLAAYRYADVVGLRDGSEVPLPEVDSAAILMVHADKYQLIEMRADLECHRTFLYLQQLYRWSLEGSKSVIGEMVMPVNLT